MRAELDSPIRYYYGSVINYRYSWNEGGDPWECMVVHWEDGARGKFSGTPVDFATRCRRSLTRPSAPSLPLI
jgi:hypothetical protein